MEAACRRQRSRSHHRVDGRRRLPSRAEFSEKWRPTHGRIHPVDTRNARRGRSSRTRFDPTLIAFPLSRACPVDVFKIPIPHEVARNQHSSSLATHQTDLASHRPSRCASSQGFMDDVSTDALAFMSFLINSVKRLNREPNGRPTLSVSSQTKVRSLPRSRRTTSDSPAFSPHAARNAASSVWRGDLILLIIARETSVKSR
jgi:hypothetical protein